MKKETKRRKKQKGIGRSANKGTGRKTRKGGGLVYTAQSADVRAKEIFDNPELCAQFLRDYSEMPLFADIRPGDIEDVTQRFHTFAEAEYSSDSVKKINLHRENGDGTPLYVVSLIDHKSGVDFDVSMQLLKYMVGIWGDWRKEMEKTGRGKHTAKGFRYPPVFPIVYHEGEQKWTAGRHLSDRIMMPDIFGKYIPDFEYKLVENHAFTNEELLLKEDEISLLMMLAKFQRSEDFREAREIPPDKLDRILENSSEQVLELMASVVRSLCRKVNMPEKEADEYVQKVRGRRMGYLFENMEKIDIQEERRKAEEERKRAEAERKKTEEERKRAEEERRQKEEAQKKAAYEHEHAILVAVKLGRKYGQSKEAVAGELSREFGLDASAAAEKTAKYWEVG